MCSFAGLFSRLDSRSEPTLADLLKVDMLQIPRVDGLIGDNQGIILLISS